MPSLTTTCEFCGEIELPISRVLLRIDPARNISACVVRCPNCGHRFLKHANEAMVVMLLAVGIEVSLWSSSASDPLEEGPDVERPISHDDLARFRRSLVHDRDILRHLATP